MTTIPPSQPLPVIAKPWWQSLTVWTNVAALVGLILGVLADNLLALGIPASVGVWIAIAIPIVNGIIRVLRTSQPLSVQGIVPSIRPPDPQPPTRK